ncbi:major facilitator superfamily domain-containing protein [Aspergillus welwitschiae]|uniref:Major facilitator superfamily domain-containing protein n=1 Tax=Aspergillus welwitschiae TaxID=1341132 RepID=A0A3F3PKV3_9EURO|nr:major facilitator superfamily domain-containing protein [Aspergillus welwitschiae]RDH27565.1 major facilitator superfamily domain-containing protein [Aspergillus welwitschiae]
MPLGILDDDCEHVPGTVTLVDQGSNAADTCNVRHGTSKDAHVILVPQPTDNPNDPLNWSLWRRNLVFAVVFTNTIIMGAVPPPLLAASLQVLSVYFGRPTMAITLLSGYQLVLVAALGPIVSALARKYGKRPQFVFAAIMAIIGTVIYIGSGNSYNVLLAGRLVQGLGIVAFESLSLGLLGDLYFVHERGSRAGLLALSLTCMSAVVSIVSGPITENLGWRYMFIVHLPFEIAGAITVIFFLPETQFQRPTCEQRSPGSAQADTAKQSDFSHDEIVQTVTRPGSLEAHHLSRRKRYVQTLAIVSGTYTNESVMKLLLAPFITLVIPSVTWSILVGGIAVAFYGTLSYILGQIWSAPPYFLGSAGNGYFYVGALLGGLIGGIGGAKLCDLSTNWLTKRNRGVYEPEFRIPAQIIAAALLCLGFFLFMWDVEHPTKTGYFLGSFCHGCICAGVTIAATSSSVYILDAHPDQAIEVFILLMSVKNFIFYGFSYFMNGWVSKSGPGDVFKVFGIVSACLLATSLPMCK